MILLPTSFLQIMKQSALQNSLFFKADMIWIEVVAEQTIRNRSKMVP